jgi:hypothetical protein
MGSCLSFSSRTGALNVDQETTAHAPKLVKKQTTDSDTVRVSQLALMVERIEKDAVLVDQLQTKLYSEFQRAGLLGIEWPPPKNAVYVPVPAEFDLDDFRIAAKKRYCRQIYENALAMEGARILIRNWQPWNHCMVKSKDSRAAIVYLFIVYTLR